MKSFEQMKVSNGFFMYEGRTYVLTEQAYDDGCYYRATAICTEDISDDGFRPAYDVMWDYADTDLDDPADDIDWEHPYDVSQRGEYCEQDGRIV